MHMDLYSSQMNTRRNSLNKYIHFWTLKLLQEKPVITQHTLAMEVSVSLSVINYCINALAKKRLDQNEQL